MGVSIFLFEYTDNPFTSPASVRLSGLAPSVSGPAWVEEELYGTDSSRNAGESWPSWATATISAAPAFLLIVVALRRLTSRLRTIRARESLGPPREVISDDAIGAPITLRGELTVKGEPIERFENGAPAAASTASSSGVTGALGVEPANVTRRALRLVLHVGDNAVEIVGPVEVIVGSIQHDSARGFDALPPSTIDRIVGFDENSSIQLAGSPVALRSVAPGDVVRAAGALVWAQPAETDQGYRHNALRLALKPLTEAGVLHPVRLAYEGDPARPSVMSVARLDPNASSATLGPESSRNQGVRGN